MTDADFSGPTSVSRADRPRRIVAVSAGLSQPSSTKLLADRLSAAAVDALGADPGGLGAAQVQVIELREHAHAIADAMLTGFPSGALREAVQAVGEADGLILVSPTFTASYSGLFKSFIDILDPDALQATPVLLGATGGTERHSLMLDHAMRPLMAYLRAAVTPTAVYAASVDWGAAVPASGRDAPGESPGRAAPDALAERVRRAAGELAAIIERRPAGEPARDGFADPVPFEQLLGG